jgi:eukaryotic-like serine/threonine-protein kinase
MTPERWKQIEELFHAARARPVHERAAYLAGACPADEKLRREVENLLSQSGSNEGFLAGPVAAIAAGLGTVPPAIVGRRLGGYEVQALIGVGGMGEVYRARDLKLGRAVAIKVLPHAFTKDPARLARFEREARTLAALNHPNICAIHGFDEADQVRFLVLELVEGVTLADRLAFARTPERAAGLTQRDALAIARQIAKALDFAHERGIVHRDLKPANVKIGSDGSVKVLDFGLAKAASGDAAGADLEALPSITADGTLDGAIVGTPAYMSPEQARGKTVDKRTDIWSFGCVLYEMLTGRAVFGGDTLADTIAKVIEREPDWMLLPADTPEPIRHLLVGCLAKDPRERLRDIGDVRITIDSILSGSIGSSGSGSAVRSRVPVKRWGAWLPWAVATALASVLIVTWNLRPPPGPPPSPSRWPYDLPAGQSLDGSGGAHLLTLSHDGSQLAYVATPRLLYIRPITNDPEAKPVPGTEKNRGVREVRFSPNGKEIAFYSFADRTIARMNVSGGESQTICDAETPTGLDWGRNGTVLFGQGRKGIWRASVNTRLATRVAAVDANQEAHGPQLLPDGDHFLFTVATGHTRDRWDKAEIFVGSLSTPTRIKLGLTGSDARYLPQTGHLLYAIGGSIYAVGFDPQTLQVRGTGVRVEEGVSRAIAAVTGAANFSVSDNGTLAFVPGPKEPAPIRMELALFDPSGKTPPRRLNVSPGQYEAIRASPDESVVAYGKESDTDWTVYIVATDDKTEERQLTADGSNNRFPIWTPDSSRVAFQSDRGGVSGIWWQKADGSGEADLLTKASGDEVLIPESWSTDNTLLYSVTKDGLASLWTLPVLNGNPGEARPFGQSKSTDPMSGVFSPNGALVAYTKTDKGETTVCVEPFPSRSSFDCVEQNPALADSPKHPRWSKDGKRLFFDPRPGGFESASVTPTGSLGTPEPVKYHPFRLSPPGTRTPYDVTTSGKFLGQIPPGTDDYHAIPAARTIIVVLNWFEALKEKMK